MPKSNRKPALPYKGNIKKELEAAKGNSYLASQKKWLLQALILSAVGFIALKFCFPLPDIDLDGINYVSWAYTGQKIGYRPMGYPHFLQMIHNVSDSIYAVVPVQYMLSVISLLFAFFSADYLFGIPARLKQLLIIVVFLNPLLLFQANAVSSDSLFCSLTVVLITLCMWFAKKADWRLFIPVVATLYFCLAVRYAAFFYPFLVFVGIVLCRIQLRAKLVYAASVIAVVLAFVQNQKNTVWEITKSSVFSGFSGWQIANNALYTYKKIKISATDLPTAETRAIDSFVKNSIDQVKTTSEVGDAYIWDKNSPLKKYTDFRAAANKEKYFFSWFKVSEDLDQYGWYIIKNNPIPFARYYLYPNFKRFFYPETWPLTNYNTDHPKFPVEIGLWFNWENPELSCRFSQLQKRIISVYPPLCALLNVFNIIAILFFLQKAVPARKSLPHTVWILFFTWAAYYFGFMAFSVFASDIYLRFLDSVFAISLVFSGILLKEAVTIKRAVPVANLQSSIDDDPEALAAAA